MRGALMAPAVIMDDVYALPTRKWIAGAFSDSYWSNLRARCLAGYLPNKNDCDKFARRAWADASDCHARTPGHEGQGLAFGLWLYVAPGGPHCINFAICGETPEDVLFWEPQTQRIVPLTTKEIESCFGYII